MSLTPLAFTGISDYSSDFQTILKRAVDLAALPIKALQNNQVDLLAKKQLLSDLRNTAAELTSRLTSLGSVGAMRALTATSSNPAKVTVTNVSAGAAATYSITEVTSMARAAAETTLAGYADASSTPVSSTGTVRLTYGSQSWDIVLGEGKNNLQGLRDEINKLNAGVSATVLTTGTGEHPNFLSLSANTPGAATLTLVDDPEGAAASLLTNANQGANTEFKLNGVPVSKKTTFINDVIPGVTFTLLDTTSGAETITLNLATDRSGIASALANFAAAYNVMAQKLNAQIGPDAGLLSGDMIIRQVQGKLRELTNYEGPGGIRNLAELGIELDRTGAMTFNQAAFDRLTDTRVDQALDFLGSASTGFAAFAKDFASISDPFTGLIALQQNQIDRADRRIQDQMAAMIERVDQMQRSLSLRLQQADALLAQIENQRTVVDASLLSLSTLVHGKKGS